MKAGKKTERRLGRDGRKIGGKSDSLRDKWQSEFFRENAMRDSILLNRGVVHRRNYFLNFLSMEKSFEESRNQKKELGHWIPFSFFLL